MICCDIVGKVSFVIVYVSPTLNLRSAHDFKNSLSSFVKSLHCSINGVLEQFPDTSVTFDANSVATLRQMKHISPMGTSRRIKIIPAVTPSRIARNRAAIIRSSAPVTYAGTKILKTSMALLCRICVDR